MADTTPNGTMPEVDGNTIGWLTEEQMIEVDRVMIEDLRIELIQMMENAGRNLAELILRRYRPSTVTVLAGSGGNGGGGLVAARHLANRGVDVAVTVAKPESLGSIPAHQFGIVERMGLDINPEPRSGDVAVDALIGYSLRGAPTGRIGELIDGIGRLAPVVVSLDTPSGLNVTDGSTPGPVVAAAATMTLALPKIGLRNAPQVGELYLADISVPPSVYDDLGVATEPPFTAGPIVRCVSHDGAGAR